MSLYSERLAKLKKEIIQIGKIKNKKRWKPNQFIMINFINGVTKKAEFIINKQKVILTIGTDTMGFTHMLKKHYCNSCEGEISTMDILNITDIIERGIILANVGVSNKENIVYRKIKGNQNYNIILKSVNDGSLIISMYSIG